MSSDFNIGESYGDDTSRSLLNESQPPSTDLVLFKRAPKIDSIPRDQEYELGSELHDPSKYEPVFRGDKREETRNASDKGLTAIFWNPQYSSQWDHAVRSAAPADVNAEPTPWIGGFKYTPLDENSNSFRLFVLAPSTSYEGQLEGSLIVASLDSYPVYETLSYVWGDLSCHEIMKLHDLGLTQNARRLSGSAIDFKITPSLALALRELRHPLVTRTLWVDCICINQQDNDDRSNQVQQMAKIYRQGARSMIWLGGDYGGRSGCVLRLLNDLSTAPHTSDEELRLQKQIWEEWEDRYLETGGSLDELNPKTAIQKWILDFFDNRNLWNRIWVMQEIVFAPHPFLLCGSQTLPWEALGRCIDQRTSHLSFILRNSQSWRHAGMINQRRKQLVAQSHLEVHKSDLLSLFLRCQTFQSTDSRDMLYALLNLTNENPGIKPNYNISSGDMWIAFGKALMAHTKSLLLLYQDESVLTVSERGLPSWISYSLKPVDFWFDMQADYDTADFSIGYMPQDHRTSQIVIRHLPVMGVLVDTLPHDLYPDYPFYRLYSDETHNGYWDCTEVDRNYQNAKNLMQDCLKEFLPTHMGRVQTSSLNSAKVAKKRDVGILAISGDRRLLKKEIQLYEQQRQRQKWDRLAISELISGTGTAKLSDRLRRLRFNITRKGFPVLLPPSAKEGDLLFVLFGCPVPIVLRPLEPYNTLQRFRVVGQAFVHGADRGQVIHPDYFRNDEYLWREPLVEGTEGLSWGEKKTKIHNARVELWESLLVDKPTLIILE